jgi:LysM repeat protein
MKKLLLFLATSLQLTMAFAQNESKAPKIFFPYFRVNTASVNQATIQPQSTQVLVQIDGLKAEVSVKQIYQNLSDKPLEAFYVFPAQLSGLNGQIGKAQKFGKPDLHSTAQNNETYQLLLQNIQPKEEIQIEWTYAEILPQNQDFYEFRFPAATFTEVKTGENPGQKKIWVSNPHLAETDAKGFPLDLKILFHTDTPIKEVSSELHLIDVHYPSVNTAEVILDKSETNASNRDFVLHYRLASTQDLTVKNTEKIPTDEDEVIIYRGDNLKASNEDNILGEANKEVNKHHSKKHLQKPQTTTLRTEYEVKEGDYLLRIAQQYKITPEEIKKWNKMDSDKLELGETLTIYAEYLKDTHTVAEDEYLYQIAQMYGCKVADLLEWNQLENDKLFIGQKLLIYKRAK